MADVEPVVLRHGLDISVADDSEEKGGMNSFARSKSRISMSSIGYSKPA